MIYLIDEDGYILYVNSAAAATLNLSAPNVIGKHLTDVFSNEIAQSHLAAIKHVFVTKQKIKNEILEKFPLGEMWIEVSLSPLFNENGEIIAVLGLSNDISARKATEEKLRKLSQVVEQSPVSIVITDTHGSIEYVNPKFTEVTGYSFEEAIGKNPRILKSETTNKEDYRQLWHTILSGKNWCGEFYNRKKNGDHYWENATISPILNEKKEISHFLAIKEDITQRKQVEQELLIAKEKAEESDHLKSAFLANMSHEIRTPMNGILGFAELLKEPDLSGDEQQEYLRIIEKSGERMLNIINDIIDISKIEAGQMRVSMNESNINSQIDYIYTFFKPEVENKGMKLIMRNSLPDKEVHIITDREKLFAILINLVKNAIKYSEKGTIEFGYEKKDKYLEFYVKDMGIGIAKERLTNIFERFVQVDISDLKARQGAGLGLAISKSYVEMLGGKIWVESEIGIGSAFYFTIPFNREEDKCIAERDEVVTTQGSQIEKLKILIADDDEISVLLISKVIKALGREIIKVTTGEEAVAACRSNSDIDLVLMDIQLPILNGYEATQQIRQFNKDVIIIAQTAYALTGDRENAIRIGCNDYITKPINRDELRAMISKHCKK